MSLEENKMVNRLATFAFLKGTSKNKNSVLQLGILVDSVWIPAILKDNQIKYTLQGAWDNRNKINDF